jgi:hypothetical protein
MVEVFSRESLAVVVRRHGHCSLRTDREAPVLQTAAYPDGTERDQPGA